MDNGILGPMRVRDMTHSMYILPILLAVRLNDSTVDADNCLKSCYRYDRCTGSHHMQRLPGGNLPQNQKPSYRRYRRLKITYDDVIIIHNVGDCRVI
jgi:hypothetical protein